MGVCSSCRARAVSSAALMPRKTTAKLVLEDGRLQEFENPVKVSEILSQRQGGGRHPLADTFFVCDSDVMGMEGLLSAMDAKEELKPGQLYFLLPLSMMRRPFRPQDLAKLVLMASSALIQSSGVLPLVFPAAGPVSLSGQRRGMEEQRKSHRRRVNKEGSGRLLYLDLSVIPENAAEEETEEGR